MTRPALVLPGRQATPAVMSQLPRERPERLISRWLLLRTWALMGTVSSALVLAVFFADLLHAGWRPGAPVGLGSPLYGAYREATTATFVAIVACQIGAAIGAWAAPTRVRRIQITTNPAFAGALLFGVVLCFAPPVHRLFAAAALHGWVVLLLAACPAIVLTAEGATRRMRRDATGTFGRGGPRRK